MELLKQALSKLDSNRLIFYSISPNLNFDIPCKNETFSNIGIEIEKVENHEIPGSVLVKAIAKNTVTEIYLSNDSTCATGGNWQELKQNSLDWTLSDATLNTEGKHLVYAKVRDIFDQESRCVSAEILYQAPDLIPPSATSITIDEGASTRDASPDLTLAATDVSDVHHKHSGMCLRG